MKTDLIGLTIEQAVEKSRQKVFMWGEIDRQRVYILRMYLVPMPCPLCGTPVNKLSAALKRVVEPSEVIDDNIIANITDSAGETHECPHCKAGLEYVLPFMGPTQWRLSDAEREKLRAERGVK